ncbi:MAG: hypothetical protein ACLGI3_06590, partial [Actinomycetes bacterium]
SRTHVEDRQARGLPAGPPSPEPRFSPPDPAATSWTWLDARLRYPRDLPPDDVLRRGQEIVVQRWSVPVEVDGAPAALAGVVRWVPEPSLRAAATDSGGLPGWWPVVPALALLAAAVLVVRRRTTGRG